MRLLDEEIAALQATRVGEVHKLVHHVLFLQVVDELHHLLEVLELGAVVICIVERKLQDESAHACLFEVGGHAQRVLGHEDVGSDAAASIDHPAQTGVVSGTRVLDAVLREELSMLVACEQVLLIVLVIAHSVGLLDTSARWRVVTGDGEADHAVVGELQLLLHQTLAEGTAADDGGAVVVLHGTGEDLGGRRRALVEQHHQWNLLIGSLAVTAVFLAGRLAALGIDNQTLVGQELVCHVDCCRQVAARVVAQVDAEVLESLLRQLCQCNQHLGIGVLAKVLDADISRVVIQHIGGGDALGGNLAAGNGERLHLLASVSDNSNLHLRVLGTLQASHRLLVGDNLAHEGLVVHRDNLVACQ